MIATISKEFAFSASHQLEGLAAGHPCSRVHGHNYLVRAVLVGEPDEVGFVLDYGMLKPFQEEIAQRFDHRHLNEEVSFNPTAEHLAEYLVQVLRANIENYTTALSQLRIHRIEVGVSETPKTWARVGEDW